MADKCWITDAKGNSLAAGRSGDHFCIRTHRTDDDPERDECGPIVELTAEDALALAATILDRYGFASSP